MQMEFMIAFVNIDPGTTTNSYKPDRNLDEDYTDFHDFVSLKQDSRPGPSFTIQTLLVT